MRHASSSPAFGVRAATSYAVVWSDDAAPPRAGRLVVSDRALELHGAGADGKPNPLVVDGGTLVRAYSSRNGDRLNGCPTIVLERRDGTRLRIGALEFCIVSELLDLVAALTAAAAPKRVLVVLPLRPGSTERARELIERGPPFDPAAIGLTRHEVFLSEGQVSFLLEGPHIDETVERLLREVSVWRGAAAWRTCLAGRPKLAAAAYSWPSDSVDQ